MNLRLLQRASALLLFILLSCFASENFVIKNDDILPQKTVQKINEIGEELYRKTGVSVYVAVVKNMGGKKIVLFEKGIVSSLHGPYVLLTLSVDDKKVDIVSSKEVANRFDKEEILSPWPWKGSIIPLLTSHSKNPKAAIEAAILNGYSEIAEQIARSYGVKLNSAIGNTNREIYYWLRVVFYSILGLIFANFIYRRFIKQ